MASSSSYTLSNLARRLGAPQHRLIHLCEKGVIVPEVSDAAGRGSSRSFSAMNYLEFAVALRLRDMFVPVSELRGIIHVLREFSHHLERRPGAQSLPEELRKPNSPELRIILSDGKRLFFSLGQPGAAARLFGGVSLDQLESSNDSDTKAATISTRPFKSGAPSSFGEPEGSEFTRLELSVNAVARSLQFD